MAGADHPPRQRVGGDLAAGEDELYAIADRQVTPGNDDPEVIYVRYAIDWTSLLRFYAGLASGLDLVVRTWWTRPCQ